jgi:ubiquinone/menaquinone biosynthesis C-methylase UbiE
MRGEPIELTETYERDGRQMLHRVDKALADRIYTAMRNASLAVLSREERAWLHGKTLLDVGCGSGREVAELWHYFGGDIHITAVDPVKGMLELAERDFLSLLNEVEPGHPPVTPENQPAYKLGSATKLPFDDNSFHAVFYSQILHWTADPRRAIAEFVRVVKPGGIIFGAQALKPYVGSSYQDLVVRTNENSHGIFWIDEYRHWFGEHGLTAEIVSPAGVVRVRKPA